MRASRWPSWIERQLVRRGICDERVLQAFSEVSRAPFVPRKFRDMAQEDAPIRLGHKQTVSQPYIIALSLQALELKGHERVLDVGTGSGFQAVLLSRLAKEVYTIEIVSQLHMNARLPIEQHQQSQVVMKLGDGSMGWPERAPFDAIVVGSRAAKMPEPLVRQLAPNGRMVIPVGGESGQSLYRVRKLEDGTLARKILERVLFVPLTGREGTGTFPR